MNQCNIGGGFLEHVDDRAHVPCRAIECLWLRLYSGTLQTARHRLLKLILKMWLWQSWTEESQRYRSTLAFRHSVSLSWTVIATQLHIRKGLRVSYCFHEVLTLSLTCKGLRVMCLRTFRTWWIQLWMAIRNPANATRLGGVPFLMMVKLSATVWNLECRSVSSGVDHLNSNNASEV